ncbi:hypothetical protein [Amycolatopsis sp. NPDC059657]|uniref:hypothetical protein n=1 Tax=Amycolatopsis sp. NPDC059657 TaxID=3346899 RepID=UPI0036716794
MIMLLSAAQDRRVKPSVGTNVTFEEFVHARLLVLEILGEKELERLALRGTRQESQDAREVFVQWERARLVLLELEAPWSPMHVE